MSNIRWTDCSTMPIFSAETAPTAEKKVITMSLLSITGPSGRRPTGHSNLRSTLAEIYRIPATLLRWPFRVWENRRVLHTMAQMSDHALADIGLTHQDLADTTALSLSSDLGAFLSARVNERRLRR